MAAGAGFTDAEGIWHYGEDDTETLMSDLLNLGQQSVSDALTLDRVRLAQLEVFDRVILSRNTATFNLVSGTASQVTDAYLTKTKEVGATASGGAITVTRSGDYWVGASAQFIAQGGGLRQLYVNKNSTTPTTNPLLFDETPGDGAAAVTVSSRRLITLTAGDVLRMFIAQNSGSVLGVLAGASQIPGTFFEVVWAGA